MTIQLQSIGKAPSIAAKDLRVGMMLVWNFGEAYNIMDIQPKGSQSLVITQESLEDGKIYKQTVRKSKQVCGFFPQN